jgi:hypothetical protein
METKHDINKELENLSPFLAKIEKGEEAKKAMPAGYFEHLPDRVLHQIYALEAVDKKPHAPAGWWEAAKIDLLAWLSPRYMVPLTACFILLLAGYFVKNTLVGSGYYLSAIDKEEAVQYLHGHIDEIDENLLANLHPNFTDIAISQDQEHIKSYLEENEGYDDLVDI